MSEIKGYTGKQLRINLNLGTVVVEDTKAAILPEYLGGVGYAAKVLYDELEAGIDPLGPDNKIIFSTGPLSDRKVPGGGSVAICFKSPLTGGWSEARSGGEFGPMLRKAGYDHLIVEGKSVEPVYLQINNSHVILKSGRKLIGKTVSQKMELLHQELESEDYTLMCIGPGGEHGVLFAGAMFSGDRTAARGGGGAVLGTKNLLAIAVKGNCDVVASDNEQLQRVIREAHKVLKSNPMSQEFRNFGTIGDMSGCDDGGDWPTKNWQSNSWGKAPELYEHYEKHNYIKPYTCYRGCPLSCGRKAHVKDGPFKTPEHGGAQYESVSCFTAYILNEDMDAAIHCSYLCDEYGIDTISTGAVIAFVMECYEKGIVTREDCSGLDLTWGNAAVLPEVIRMIANREGIGDLLANGVKSASEALGQNSDKFAIHVKGMEGPAHDPRSGKSMALAYGTANRGMCHIHPLESMAWDYGKMDWGLKKYGLTDPETIDRWDEVGKGKNVKLLQDAMILPDILGTCKFFMTAGLTLDDLAEILAATTGWDVDAKKLMEVGERVINIQRLFNMREGFRKKDDMVPSRIISTPAFGKYEQHPECATSDYEAMLQEYYEAREWDLNTGIPTKEKCSKLGIDW